MALDVRVSHEWSLEEQSRPIDARVSEEKSFHEEGACPLNSTTVGAGDVPRSTVCWYVRRCYLVPLPSEEKELGQADAEGTEGPMQLRLRIGTSNDQLLIGMSTNAHHRLCFAEKERGLPRPQVRH